MHRNNTVKRIGMALLFAGCLASTAWSAPRGWQVKYGSAQGQVGYYNSAVNPKLEEASPLGPMAFRLQDGELWLADSIGGRLLCLGSGGALKATLKIPGVGTDTLLEDIALVKNEAGKVEAAWVADGADLFIRKIAVPSGKELARVGGRGDEPGRFAQIHQLEVGPTGRLYVGDFGRRLIAVFDQAGTLLREIPWERSGFAVDAGERLSTLVFIEGIGYVRHRYSPDGRLENAVHLGLPALQNPRLWWLDPDGGFTVSFIPAGGFRGHVTLHAFSSDGALLKKYSVRPAQGMNRFMDRSDDGNLWFAAADVNSAPKGTFKVVPYTHQPTSAAPAKGKQADPWAALKIRKQAVATMPGVDPATLIGIRTEANTGVILLRDGREIRLDLATGKQDAGAGLATGGQYLLDFTLAGSGVVGLTSDGMLIGSRPSSWPAGPFAACRIDISGGEGFLSGGTTSRYLAPQATETVEIPGNSLSIPLKDGFLWSLSRSGARAWEASLIDGFGNQMKKVFRFSPEFDPTGIAIGPNGPEGELLVSCFVGASRELILVGQNGRMLWKLPASAPVCPRDLAWDAGGSLLVLEKAPDGLVLNRITFEIPQG